VIREKYGPSKPLKELNQNLANLICPLSKKAYGNGAVLVESGHIWICSVPGLAKFPI